MPDLKKTPGYLLLLYCLLNTLCTTREKIQHPDPSLALLSVPEGFSVESATIPGLVNFPMFASFDSSGRLFVCESDGNSPSLEEMLKKPTHTISMLEDTDNNGIFDKRTLFADSLTFPKGAVFYKGSLYVASAPDLLRLTDTDGDGEADRREKLLTGWVFHNNGALMGGPFLGPDGWLYITDARRGFDITTKEGENIKGSSTRIWRCRPDGSGLESYCSGGYDNAIELAFMPSGETIGTMTYFTEPRGGERDALMHWVEGGVYPKPYPVIEQDKLPLTGELMPVMTKTARVAPSGIMRYRSEAFGAGYTGSLFSAEFNTGRILRHRITDNGATYTTREETFLRSSSGDIHLTDVLEDADGSLLVINTGGWFISGCPLSRMAKPEMKGGIYRVRRNGMKTPDDPWGRETDLHLLKETQLKDALKDGNAVMHDRIFSEFGRRGKASVTVLGEILRTAPEPDRIRSVYTLAGMKEPEAMTLLLTALEDSSSSVITAAARMAGLNRNEAAVEKLIGLLSNGNLQVRRQAATALGRIGDNRAVQPLIDALSAANDRFSEHALLYALIGFKKTDPLRQALRHTSVNVRRGALIALDQTGEGGLQENDLYPFLNSDDSLLMHTGLWVAAHHKTWINPVLTFLKRYFEKPAGWNNNPEQVRQLVIGFSGHAEMKKLLSSYLSSEGIDLSRKMFVLDIISDPGIRDIPGEWTKALNRILSSGDDRLREKVLSIAASGRINGLGQQLNTIIHDKKNPPEFRMQALLARLGSNQRMSSGEFELVNEYLKAEYPAHYRRLAVSLLSAARLTNEQLSQLAISQVAVADSWLLPGLLKVYEGNNDRIVGEELVKALSVSPDRTDHFTEASWNQLMDSFPPEVRRGGIPILETIRKKSEERLSQLQLIDSSLQKGDIGNGNRLFFGKATCGSCHAVAERGATFGPDLTNIGQIRTRHDILEAILYPDVSFAREHETFEVKTQASLFTGIIKRQYTGYLVMETGPGVEIRINRDEIEFIRPVNRSMMPPGLDKILSQQELADLMAYLESLPDGMGGRKSGH